MVISIKKGLDLPLAGVPEQTIDAEVPVSRIAFQGSDFLSLRQLPTVMVEEGQRVSKGQPLVRSKKYPDIIGVAQGAGVVERIVRGKKRSLQAITIQLEGDEEQSFNQFDSASLGALTSAQIRENLLASGLWLSLRTRPYSIAPPPDGEPTAIFVTAIDTQPLAPSPEVIIAAAADDFVNGLHVISKLCGGPTYLCVAANARLPEPCHLHAKVVSFGGVHPAGLVGTHIHHLSPIAEGDVVWTINYQDVIAVGRLFTSGRLAVERVVALSGPMMKRPRLVKTRIGAHLEELLAEELADKDARVISGSVLSGRHAIGDDTYLGWFDYQVTAISEGYQRELLGWIAPGRDKFSILRAFLSHWRSRGVRFDMNSSYHGSSRAMVPIGVYERVMPLDLLITPLLRALLVGDTEAAIELGCMELDEEDLALCSFVCPSKHDFGRALRKTLDQIQLGD